MVAIDNQLQQTQRAQRSEVVNDARVWTVRHESSPTARFRSERTSPLERADLDRLTALPQRQLIERQHVKDDGHWDTEDDDAENRRPEGTERRGRVCQHRSGSTARKSSKGDRKDEIYETDHIPRDSSHGSEARAGRHQRTDRNCGRAHEYVEASCRSAEMRPR